MFALLVFASLPFILPMSGIVSRLRSYTFSLSPAHADTAGASQLLSAQHLSNSSAANKT